MAIKIAIANMKGGIGKTTTALCLSHALQNKGYKVLLIDSDPQRSASGVYNAKTDNTATLADMMYENKPASECIQHLELGDIIAADNALQYADTQIPTDADRFYHINDTCSSIEDQYDFIIFDCPPGNGVMLGNVLSYVNHIIIPITCDKFGVQGLFDFKDVISMYSKRINPTVNVLGVLIVKYKGRQNLTRDLEDNLIPQMVENMNTILFNTKIRESVKCQEAQALGKSLFTHAAKSSTAIDYELFSNEILKEIGIYE